MLKEFGCVNIADSDDSLLTELSLEAIVQADPDYIFISCMGDLKEGQAQLEASLTSNPIWDTLQAVENNRLFWLDKELFQYPSNQRAQKVSYLSQSTNTPNITVERLLAHARFPHLSYPKKLRHKDISIIYKALGDMKAVCFAQDSLRVLSGGERQRVYLAMQLAQDVPILLLDEPTTYLDIEYQLSLMELLQKLKAQGKTIIMVLHDLQQALKYSDRIIAIDAGKEIYTRTPQEMLDAGLFKKVFHVDIQHSDYRIELKNPAAYRSEAIVIGFGSNSCRSR